MDQRWTTRRVPRLAQAALACALALGLLAACGSENTAEQEPTSESTALPPEGDPVDGGTLAVGITFDTTGWNPTIDQWGTATVLAGSAMLEPLATFGPDAEALPWLATSWEPNEDFTAWTLKLRDDVVFHNGEKFNAEAVKQNLTDTIASPLTGIALGGVIVDADIVDDYTVTVRLSTPWAAFPTSFLAGPNAWMRAPAMLAAGADSSLNPIGTGPFKFASWVSGEPLKLVANKDYWREGEPHLDELEFTAIVDDLSRTNALLSGDLDMMLTGSARDATDLEGEYTVIKDWDTETNLLIVNTRETAGGQPNPMSNLHARLAIAHATDASQIASLVGDGIEVATSPFSEDNPWHDPAAAESVPAFDQEKAKEEVAAYEADTGQPLKIRLTGPTETSIVALLQALQQQWAEVGIETEIEALEQSAYSMQGVLGNYQVEYAPIYTAPDPDQNYLFWSETTTAEDGAIGINFSGYATETSQAALIEGRTNSDTDIRRKAYTDFLTEINENGVNVWLFFQPYSLVASDRVHGLQPASEIPFGNFQPKTWWGGVWVSD